MIFIKQKTMVSVMAAAIVFVVIFTLKASDSGSRGPVATSPEQRMATSTDLHPGHTVNGDSWMQNNRGKSPGTIVAGAGPLPPAREKHDRPEVWALQGVRTYSEYVERLNETGMSFRDKYEYNNVAKTLCGAHEHVDLQEGDDPSPQGTVPPTNSAHRSEAYFARWADGFCDIATENDGFSAHDVVSKQADPYAIADLTKLITSGDFESAREYGEQILSSTESPLMLRATAEALRAAEFFDPHGSRWQFGRQYLGQFQDSYGNARFGDLQILAVEMVACGMGNICGSGDLFTMLDCRQSFQCGNGRNLEDIWDITYSPAALTLARKMADDLRHMRDGS